jgi:hypothetical protein
MSNSAKSLAAGVLAAIVFGLLALALERNPWIAIFAAVFLGVLVFYATNNYYAQLARLAVPDDLRLPSRWAIPFTSSWHTRRLVAAGRIDEAGRRLVAGGDWVGAWRLIAGSVAIREVREPLLHLLHAWRGFEQMQASLPPETPDAFRGLARETVVDVSQRLWAKTEILARLSRVALPATAEAEVAAEGKRIDDLTAQVEDATTDLLKLSLAGYDSHGISRGTELLAAVKRKAEVLLSSAEDDLG